MKPREEMMLDMATLQNATANVSRIVCKNCGYWQSKWASSFNEELKVNCPACKEARDWEGK